MREGGRGQRSRQKIPPSAGSEDKGGVYRDESKRRRSAPIPAPRLIRKMNAVSPPKDRVADPRDQKRVIDLDASSPDPSCYCRCARRSVGVCATVIPCVEKMEAKEDMGDKK